MADHHTPQRFTALIIDPDLDARMRLKQATTAVTLFSTVQQISGLTEAPYALEGYFSRCDVVFLSQVFPHSDLQAFVVSAKQIKQAEDAAFVQIVKKTSEGGVNVAQQLLDGFDGFLVEPYSVDQLVEITRLASKVKRDRGEARTRLALNMLIGDAATQIDLVAFMKAQGYDVAKSKDRLAHITDSLKSLGQANWDEYTKQIVEALKEMPAPKQIMAVKKYSGVSSRVKKRMEAKILSKVGTKED